MCGKYCNFYILLHCTPPLLLIILSAPPWPSLQIILPHLLQLMTENIVVINDSKYQSIFSNYMNTARFNE